MANEPEEETYSVMFSSLKHPVRRKILRILANGPKTFTEILEQVDVESAHLSYHLESLNGLLKKLKDGKYALSEIGRASTSLMARVEEPEKPGVATIFQTPRRLKVARILFLLLILIGGSLLLSGIMALPSVDYRKSRIETFQDTDYWVFQPSKVHGFGSFYYTEEGLYGVEIDLVFQDAFEKFPLIVRLCTPRAVAQSSDFWNQSWYEFLQPNPLPAPGMRERLSVTLYASATGIQVISQESFNHVHPSPGRIIGEFRPTGNAVLIKVSPEINQNVTLNGFRGFQIRWFYFPQPQDNGRNLLILSGVVLILPNAILLFALKRPNIRKQI